MALPASILIVDDDSNLRKILVDLFTEQGVTHICDVSSAEEGFKQLDIEPFSLIICDYQLPGISGVAFMGKLRLKGDRTPILLITGVDDKTPAFTAVQNQMKVEFLAKPFTISSLLAVIESLMSR